MTVLVFALETARALGPVFPCAPRAKEPFGQLAPQGCYSATRDPSTIRRWFRAGSTLNLALAPEPGLLVLDVDPRSGGDETLGRIEAQHGVLPMTPRALTGGGGAHFLFACDPGLRIKNGAIAQGLDVKGPGGYVLVAPSIHPSGRPYLWDLGALPSETPLAPAPPWLVEAARDARGAATHRAPVAGVADSFLGVVFLEAGWLGVARGEKQAVRCPWADTHTDGRGLGEDTSAVLLPPTGHARLGAFVCAHAHCSSKSVADLIAALPPAALRAGLAKFPMALRALQRTAASQVHR